MKQISNPPVRTYWIAHDRDYNHCHYGYTDPGQTTTTGQRFFRTTTDEDVWLTYLSLFTGRGHFAKPEIDPGDPERIEYEEDKVYERQAGDKAIVTACKKTHFAKPDEVWVDHFKWPSAVKGMQTRR